LTAVIRAVPNILSAVRLLLSFALYFPEPLSAMYLFTYAACAATDPLDGFIARRYDARSRYGHLMDSLGDVSLAAAELVTLVPFLDWEPWEMILIVAVAAIRVAAFAIGSVRFGRPAFVHSYLNKAAGAAFFLSPFLIGPIGLPATVAIAGIVCLSASLEYLFINISSRVYDPDYRSVFLDKI
jgi:CDP-diacylglycerol--glycerol-3-phosphate 3-phosphatidyltransferase